MKPTCYRCHEPMTPQGTCGCNDGICLVCGDCREVLPLLEAGCVDLVLTDPPYPDALTDQWETVDITFLNTVQCKQIVFWSAMAPFPLDYTGIHVWVKAGTGVGRMYERIFERNGARECLAFREQILNNQFNARIAGDVFTGHPAQKPYRLVRRLVMRGKGPLVLDPFVGSGTTLRAAKDLGRRAIGIEIEEKYCRIAANRLRQEVLFT